MWGARWIEGQPEKQDPYLALWTIAHLIEPASLPHPRVVVRFDVTDARTYDRFWLVADRTGAEVCTEVPGFIEDGIVTSDVEALIRWYAGELTIGDRQDDGALTVCAPPWLERELGRWGRLNPYAGIPLARADPPGLEPGVAFAVASAGPAQRSRREQHAAPVGERLSP